MITLSCADPCTAGNRWFDILLLALLGVRGLDVHLDPNLNALESGPYIVTCGRHGHGSKRASISPFDYTYLHYSFSIRIPSKSP